MKGRKSSITNTHTHTHTPETQVRRRKRGVQEEEWGKESKVIISSTHSSFIPCIVIGVCSLFFILPILYNWIGWLVDE